MHVFGLAYIPSPGTYTIGCVCACVSAAGDSGVDGTEGHRHLARWGHGVAGESVSRQRRARPAGGDRIVAAPGVKALRNITVCPSLTAPSHIAIATGSTAAANDIIANTMHLIASPFASNVSGFAAPIGGYLVNPPAEAPTPTAEPIWVALRKAGKKVVTATWPGADGLDIRLPPGSESDPIL
jgi:Type I phosphodiesterase / nucleotide pyrophosphatase